MIHMSAAYYQSTGYVYDVNLRYVKLLYVKKHV